MEPKGEVSDDPNDVVQTANTQFIDWSERKITGQLPAPAQRQYNRNDYIDIPATNASSIPLGDLQQWKDTQKGKAPGEGRNMNELSRTIEQNFGSVIKSRYFDYSGPVDKMLPPNIAKQMDAGHANFKNDVSGYYDKDYNVYHIYQGKGNEGVLNLRLSADKSKIESVDTHNNPDLSKIASSFGIKSEVFGQLATGKGRPSEANRTLEAALKRPGLLNQLKSAHSADVIPPVFEKSKK